MPSDAVEMESPTAKVTIRPVEGWTEDPDEAVDLYHLMQTVTEENTVDVKCPHCGKVNKVAGHVPRDPDKPNSQGKEQYTLYCGLCGKTFTPPDMKKE
jgi:uncharacterized OB-fold protein